MNVRPHVTTSANAARRSVRPGVAAAAAMLLAAVSASPGLAQEGRAIVYRDCVPLQSGEDLSGNVVREGEWPTGRERDCYSFTLAAPADVEIGVVASEQVWGAQLRKGTHRTRNSLAHGGGSPIGGVRHIQQRLEPGWYSIDVWSGVHGLPGSNTLTVTADMDDADKGCIVLLAEDLSGAMVRSEGRWTESDCDSVHSSGSFADHYSFALSELTALEIDLSSMAVDTHVRLLEGTGRHGRVLAVNAGGRTSRIVPDRALTAGRYSVSATAGRPRETGSYALTLTARTGGVDADCVPVSLGALPASGTVTRHGQWTIADCRLGDTADLYTFTLASAARMRVGLVVTRGPSRARLELRAGTHGVRLANEQDRMIIGPGTYSAVVAATGATFDSPV